MGANQTSSTSQQQTNVANPVAQAAIAPIATMGLGVAQTPYNVGMNTNVAGQNAQQLAAIQGLGGLQTNNPANSYINQAALYSNQAADPNSVINMQKAFYNPMSQQVIGQMENVFGQQSAQQLGNAAASGAIGGSRAPIAAENLINQQDLALGQTLSGLQQQALGAAQTQQGQISQQAFTQGQLGNEALNTQIQGINQALLGGNITQQQAQNLLNAAQQNAIQQTLFPQQEAAAGENIAMGALPLGSTTVGQGTTTQPVNYLGQILGAAATGASAYASSDERVKENIEPIGKSFDKQTIYKFNYIGDPSPRIGLMAQEVEKKHPGAVKEFNGTKAVDYNKATAKSAEIGAHRLHRDTGGVVIPQTNYPTLNLNPPPPQQSQQSGGGMPPIGALSNLGGSTGIGDSLSGAASGIGDALSGAGTAIASGIGDAAGAIGSGIGDLFASGAAADFLPALALLADGGSVREHTQPARARAKHRAIGGGTGVGNGTSGVAALGGMPSSGGLLNYKGIQSDLQPYFAQSPQVQVPQMQFPTVNLTPGQNTAQQQQDQQAQQFSQLDTALGKSGIGSNIADSFATPDFGGGGADFARGGRIHRDYGGGIQIPPAVQPGALQAKEVQMLGQKDDPSFEAKAFGGRIRRPFGGGIQGGDDPNSIQAANDAFLANNQGFGLGSAIIPPAEAAITPAVAPDLTPSATNQIDKSAPLAPISSTAQNTPPTMGMRPDEYYDLNDDGTRRGAPQIPPRDPALVMASIGNPAQTAPAPIAAPQQPKSPYFEAGHPYYASLRTSESGGNPYAQAGTSSAFGPYQITEGRWHDSIQRHPELGLTDQDRLNPAAQERAIVPFTQDTQRALVHAGIEPTMTNTKMAWILGDAGAARFYGALNADPKAPADTVVDPKSVAANHNIFYNEDGTPKTVGEVYAGFNARPSANAPQPRSGLQDPSLQPSKPGESALDQRMAEFGFKPNQPQGTGSMLANALGIKPAKDPRLGNFLTNMGFGMMAAGPSVGVKGLPGAAISALTSTGKGGQFALSQEQQERKQAMDLANAATRQQLEQAQTQRALKPEWQTIRKELVPTIDPVTKMTYWKEREVKGWVNPFTQEVIEGQQPPVAPLQTPGSTPSSANAASTSSSALPGGVTFTQADGSEAPVPTAIAEKFNPEDPIDQLSLRILSGQAHMPKTQREDPRYIALKKRVYELDPTYNENRSDFYKQYGGPNGKTQLSYDAFGTALKHAHDLDDANWNKNLTDTGWSPLTTIPQAVQRARGNPKLKNYEEAATAYADEHYRTLVPSGAGTQKERERAESTVAASTPRQGRLAGNAENVSILLGKMLKLDDKYNRNMGIAASINKPPMLTEDDRQTIRDIFAHEPDQDLKKQRYERYSKDPRTADLVSPPAKKADQTQQPAQAAPAQPQQATPAQNANSISTKEQYDALPSGSQYIDSRDGKLKVKS